MRVFSSDTLRRSSFGRRFVGLWPIVKHFLAAEEKKPCGTQGIELFMVT